MPFKRFTKYLYDNYNKIVPKLGINNFIAFKDKTLGDIQGNQFHPQSEWIPDDINFVGKFENLIDDLNKLLKLLGSTRVIDKLPQVNKSNHGPYQSYYDSETTEMIKQLYHDDFERYGYSFDMPPIKVE